MYIDPGIGSQVIRMYIDPGIGSLLIQILLGLVLAIPIFLKMYWKAVKRFVKRQDK